jgi:hypothetical protein
MTDFNKAEILKIIQSDFKHTQVFEMLIDNTEYQLNPEKITL